MSLHEKPLPTQHYIKYHYDLARDIALAEVEREARRILARHPMLDEFVMGMGIATFTVKGKEHSLGISERKYMRSLENFISDWDEYLKLTGEPMRFTATGLKRTDW